MNMRRHLHHRLLPAHRLEHEHEKREQNMLLQRDPAPEPAMATVFSVVYVTATPTFTGPVGGYLTLVPPSTSAKPFFGYPAAVTTVSAIANNGFAVGYPLFSTHTAATTSAGIAAAGIPIQSSRTSTSSTLDVLYPGVAGTVNSVGLQPAASSTNGGSATAPLIASPTRAGSSSSAASLSTGALVRPTGVATRKPEETKTLSTGAEVGIAIGAVVGAALLSLLLYLLYRRRKSKRNGRRQSEDEKALRPQHPPYPPSHVSVRQQPEHAPRLSLRPITAMFPNNTSVNEKQPSSSSALPNSHGLATVPELATSPQFVVGPTSERKPMPNGGAVVVNPYANGAANPSAIMQAATPSEQLHPVAESESLPHVQPLSAAVIRKPLSVKSNRSSEGSDDRNASATIQAFPMPASLPQSRFQGSPLPQAFKALDVHRVQMDFRPSMDDELELNAGQLIRLLHEYDDGWALCSPLDGSKRGVAPRTCLSRLPVKPRPLNGPPGSSRSPPQMHPGGSRNYAPRSNGRPQNGKFSPPRQQFVPQDPRSRPHRPDYRGGGGGGGGGGSGRSRAHSNSAARTSPHGRTVYPGPFNAGQYRGPLPPQVVGERQRSNSATQLRAPLVKAGGPPVLGPSSGNGGASPYAAARTVTMPQKGLPGEAL